MSVAGFTVEGGELIRTTKTHAAAMAIPTQPDPEGAGKRAAKPKKGEPCIAPDKDQVDRFPLSI